MSVLAATANGNFTTAASWALVDTTSYLDSEAASTALTTSYVASAAFTPGAITVDGVGVKIGARSTTTGTMTIQLYNSTGAVNVANVTINTVDLPLSATSTQEGGWVFLKFAAPVLLLAATNYQVRALVSSASSITLFRNSTAGNWSRYLRTTTTQAPVAGDDMIITAEHTGAGALTARSITMDSTAATDYGSAVTANTAAAIHISTGGILSYGTTAATNYVLRVSGNMIICANGKLNIGTVGAEIPRDSTAVLEFDCAADGDFGLINRNLGTVNKQGLSRTSGKNVVQCYLNTDEAANSTDLGVDTDTGWLDNDVIAVASTTRTSSQSEVGALNGNAGASSLTVDGFAGTGGGILNAHSGTQPFAAEVINLTRNIKFRSVSTTAMTYVYNGPTANYDADWVEFRYIGTSTTAKYGVFLGAGTGGVQTIDYCSVWDYEYVAFYVTPTTGTGTATISNTVIWKGTAGTASYGLYISPTVTATCTVSNLCVIGYSGVPTYGLFIGQGYGPFNNLNATCCSYGMSFYMTASFTLPNGYGYVGSNWRFHCNSTAGVNSTNIGNGYRFANTQLIRNTSYGLWLGASASAGSFFCDFDELLSLGNGAAGIALDASGGEPRKIMFRNPIISGDTSFATTKGLYLGGGAFEATFENPKISLATGYYAVCTTRDIDLTTGSSYPNRHQIIMRNPTLGAATPIGGNNHGISNGGSIKLHSIAGNTYNYKAYYYANNSMQSNTSITYGSENLSEQMIPGHANVKFESTPCKVQVNSGTTANISVRIYKLNTYNGAEPRLILKSNYLMTGNSYDQVMNTFSGATNTWVEVTCTTPVAGENGVYTFVVDIDGTAGSVNIGNWAVT